MYLLVGIVAPMDDGDDSNDNTVHYCVLCSNIIYMYIQIHVFIII